jgi:hypothetical protein
MTDCGLPAYVDLEGTPHLVGRLWERSRKARKAPSGGKNRLRVIEKQHRIVDSRLHCFFKLQRHEFVDGMRCSF